MSSMMKPCFNHDIEQSTIAKPPMTQQGSSHRLPSVRLKLTIRPHTRKELQSDPPCLT